jgi:hypothetical protein
MKYSGARRQLRRRKHCRLYLRTRNCISFKESIRIRCVPLAALKLEYQNLLEQGTKCLLDGVGGSDSC